MNRKEEKNAIAHEIARQHTKHYDPLLPKESWCEMAAKEAIDLADKTMIYNACKWIVDNIYGYIEESQKYSGGYSIDLNSLVNDFHKAMEE